VAQGVRGASASAPESLQSSMVKGGVLGSALVASESYLGMLACGNCAGIRVELALYQESGVAGGENVTPAAYHLRETFLGAIDGDQVVDRFGVWKESADAKRWGTILDLRDARRADDTFLTSAHDNEGTLIVLDSELRELPANVPHTLARVTGNRQRNVAFLSEADDGRTVELRPGEVFLLRLKGNSKTGAMWTSDRPEAMALMESDNSGPSRDPFVDAVQTGVPSAAQPVVSGTHHTVSRPGAPPTRFQSGEIYQVWQMIAPQSGLQVLKFELHRPDRNFPWPEKVVTISILVR
jgi:NlpE N-terminal domain